MVDLRFSCSEKYKKQIRKEAIDRGTSVSNLLYEIVVKEIPENCNFIDYDELKAELDNIRNQLIYESSKMSFDEKEHLKARKNELRALIKKGETENVR